jgi:hypothetical protein
MKTFKTLGLASGLVAAALVGGTLISVVSATSTPGSNAKTQAAADPADGAAYCTQWRETFAAELGVSVDALTPAAKAATSATIDAAVANGDLPADIGERMKTALENANGDGCRLLGAGFHAWGRHAAGADWLHDWVTTAADTLDMTPAELTAELRSGTSLMDIADAQGVSYDDLSKAIVDAATADLAALVDAGKITQDRADAAVEQLTSKLASGDFPPAFGDGQRMRHMGGDQLRTRLFGGPGSSS